MATEEKEKPDDKEEPEGKEEPEKPVKPEPKVKEDDDGGVTVDLGDARPRATRRERRQESYDELRRSRDEAEGLRRRIAEMDQQFTTRVRALEERAPAGEDPYEKQLGNIRQQQEVIQAALRSGQIGTQGEVDRLRQQFYDLDAQGRKLDRDRIVKEVQEAQRKEQQPAAGAYEEQVLKAEYPDVIAHTQAMGYARGLYYQMVAEGKPPTLATSREALDKAAIRFGVRQAPLPVASAAQQAKYGAVAAQAGTKGGGEVRLDDKQRKMAVARWPQVDEHEAYTRMARLLRKAEESERGSVE